MMHKRVIIILVVFLTFILVMIGAGCGEPPSGKELIVGDKNFTEQYIIGEMMGQLLEDRGFTVELKSGHSSSYLREAIVFGDIDLYAEYTGTAWMVHLGNVYESEMDNKRVYDLVKKEEEEFGLIWLNPIWNNNTFALASWPEFVAEHSLITLSDLASLYQKKNGEVETYASYEFSRRPDGLPALQQCYNFVVANSHLWIGSPRDSLQALAQRKVDVAMVFGTDAEIAEHGWHVYMDDRASLAPYDLAPCIRKEVLDEYPEIADILNELVATFPGGGGESPTPEIVAEGQKVWQKLNSQVSFDKKKADKVAHEYLVKHGLVRE